MTRNVHSNRKRSWARRSHLAIAIALVVALASSCGEQSPAPNSAMMLPEGAWFYADAASIRALLESFETLRDTPLADAARALRERIVQCVDVVAHAESNDLLRLSRNARCASAADVPDSIATLRGDSAAGFAFEVSADAHLAGKLARAADGSFSLEARIATPEAADLMALLIPAKELPGPPSLSESETLVHARVRPHSGLNIASLVSKDSQADHMFRLRSELFLGQVLAGTWEIAIYLPLEDQITPPMALALDYSLRPAAKAAMEAFVTELESTWPIHHSEVSRGGFDGACFHDVRLLPDLTPCYVLTDRSIVVGWNVVSLELALGLDVSANTQDDAVRAPGSGIGNDGGLVIHLGRLPEADRRLQKQLLGGAPGRKLDYVWDELRMQGSNDGTTLEVRISLEMDGAS